MKIFLDTNIFLDLILKRDSQEALKILNATQKGLFRGYILDITLLNIDYVAKKQTKDIRDFLNLINDTFTIIGATNKSIKQALNIANKDFEDNLQYISAKISSCDMIISNDKNFYSKDIEVLFSKEFVSKYM